MKLVIGSDHGGYALKEVVKAYLLEQGHAVSDRGTDDGETSVDYPDYGRAVAADVAAGKYACGIVICGTGIGISLAANKVHGIRAALCTDPYMARMARMHNDANILALGGRVVGPGLALAIVAAFLDSEFAGGRHARRVDKIMAIES
ncbi:MAG TPA: ribose 5-phosphate isomerase B [Thermoflexia bacterium]|nr:ribose 5-phosphate isomerase B [Thermoflexia bacterium]